MVKTRKDDKGMPMKAYERGYYVGFKATLEVCAQLRCLLYVRLRSYGGAMFV